MKRTTIMVEEELLRKLKEIAEFEGKTLKECINEMLRIGIQSTRHKTPGKLNWKTQKMGKPMVDLDNRDVLFHTMEEK